MENVAIRIKAIIDEFHLNNYSFSKRIGVTSTTVDSIINGRPQPDGSRKRTKPGFDVLMSIINEFDINGTIQVPGIRYLIFYPKRRV